MLRTLLIALCLAVMAGAAWEAVDPDEPPPCPAQAAECSE
jgi:hypothetical protein